MKSFHEYLTESKKTYSFKVKVAGDLPEGFKPSVESAMQKYGLVKMSGPKRTPIKEVVMDFPHLSNESVCVFEIEVNYPTTPDVLQDYLSRSLKFPGSHIVVRTPTFEVDQPEIKDVYQTNLTSEYPKGDDAQKEVGSTKVASFLKELEKDRKDRACKDQPLDKDTKHMSMDEAEESTSPIGSTKRKQK